MVMRIGYDTLETKKRFWYPKKSNKNIKISIHSMWRSCQASWPEVSGRNPTGRYLRYGNTNNTIKDVLRLQKTRDSTGFLDVFYYYYFLVDFYDFYDFWPSNHFVPSKLWAFAATVAGLDGLGHGARQIACWVHMEPHFVRRLATALGCCRWVCACLGPSAAPANDTAATDFFFVCITSFRTNCRH